MQEDKGLYAERAAFAHHPINFQINLTKGVPQTAD